MIVERPASARGRVEMGWLDSRHTFSFGHYHDPEWMGFGPLRVINEDRVAPGGGFAPHSHANMEILSVVLSGGLAHRDSTGTDGVIRLGEVQWMSAGHGIRHGNLMQACANLFAETAHRAGVFGIDRGERRKHRRRVAGAVDKRAKRDRGDAETRRNGEAGARQFAEIGALAADEREVEPVKRRERRNQRALAGSAGFWRVRSVEILLARRSRKRSAVCLLLRNRDHPSHDRGVAEPWCERIRRNEERERSGADAAGGARDGHVRLSRRHAPRWRGSADSMR